MKAKTFIALAAGAVLAAPLADARITRIEITSVESPTFEGRTFGDVGAYESCAARPTARSIPPIRRTR